MNQTLRPSPAVTPMSDEEFDRVIGFRASPIDSKDYDSYLVVMTLAFAGKAGVTDQDLVDRWTIDFLLGKGGRLSADLWPLVERAIGRAVSVGEPKPFDMEAIRKEQSERNQHAAGALFE